MRTKNVYAHRYSYALHYGEVREGALVCHSCDNRSCVRPEHLFLGTAQDMSSDMKLKDRHRTAPLSGEANGRAVLSDADVKRIRATYARGGTRQLELAEHYGISQTQISRILRGRQR